MRMPMNRDREDLWAADIAQSVDNYNLWYLASAVNIFTTERERAKIEVTAALDVIDHVRRATHVVLQTPGLLPILRMATRPPIAVDRLVGLAGVAKSFVANLEVGNTYPITPRTEADAAALLRVIEALLDVTLLPWHNRGTEATAVERAIAISVLADRLANSRANPILRNSQEARQLDVLSTYLESRRYRRVAVRGDVRDMQPGTYIDHINVPCAVSNGRNVNVSIDCAVQRWGVEKGVMPVLIEAKSAGDFTNVNKRRKEEAEKMFKLKAELGSDVPYTLLLGGYFDIGYLRYEAEKGIDFIWEHRIEDLEILGV